jgi:hypothetical protein
MTFNSDIDGSNAYDLKSCRSNLLKYSYQSLEKIQLTSLAGKTVGVVAIQLQNYIVKRAIAGLSSC